MIIFSSPTDLRKDLLPDLQRRHRVGIDTIIALDEERYQRYKQGVFKQLEKRSLGMEGETHCHVEWLFMLIFNLERKNEWIIGSIKFEQKHHRT